MATKKRRRKKSPVVILFTLILVIISGIYAACEGIIDIPGITDETTEAKSQIENSAPVPEDGEVLSLDGGVTVQGAGRVTFCIAEGGAIMEKTVDFAAEPVQSLGL